MDASEKKPSRRVSMRTLLAWTAWLALLAAYFARFDFEFQIQRERDSNWRTTPRGPGHTEYYFKVAIWPWFPWDDTPPKPIKLIEMQNMGIEEV